MRAILPEQETNNARQPQNKETIETRKLIAFKKGKFKEVVTASFYMGRSNRASVVYCCIWVHGENKQYSGKGSAGGCGYHKTSLAFQEALTSADIRLVGSPYHGHVATYEEYDRDQNKRVTVKQDFKRECSIGGCGDIAIDDVMTAIAYAMGYHKTTIVKG